MLFKNKKIVLPQSRIGFVSVPSKVKNNNNVLKYGITTTTNPLTNQHSLYASNIPANSFSSKSVGNSKLRETDTNIKKSTHLVPLLELLPPLHNSGFKNKDEFIQFYEFESINFDLTTAPLCSGIFLITFKLN